MVSLAFWEGYEPLLAQLFTYAIGLAVFATLVGMFYITLSQRDLRSPRGGEVRLGLGGLLLVLPIVSFGLFLVLSVALFFLAKPLADVPEAQRVQDLLLISMALVMGVRVTAYVSEHAAVDLAKLVPLGLLGVFLVDPGLLDLNVSLGRFTLLFQMLDLVLLFLVVIIGLEVVLRALWILSGGKARARRAAQAELRSAPPPHR